jgi:CTP synthase
MRLGLRPTLFQPDTEWSTVRKLYGGEAEVHERHRHRYEINPDYITRLEENGLRFVGRDEKGERMEIFELPTHSDKGFFFVLGTFFNSSRPLDPSPPFLGFVAASAGVLDKVLKDLKDNKEMVDGVNGTC